MNMNECDLHYLPHEWSRGLEFAVDFGVCLLHQWPTFYQYCSKRSVNIHLEAIVVVGNLVLNIHELNVWKCLVQNGCSAVRHRLRVNTIVMVYASYRGLTRWTIHIYMYNYGILSRDGNGKSSSKPIWVVHVFKFILGMPSWLKMDLYVAQCPQYVIAYDGLCAELFVGYLMTRSINLNIPHLASPAMIVVESAAFRLSRFSMEYTCSMYSMYTVYTVCIQCRYTVIHL